MSCFCKLLHCRGLTDSSLSPDAPLVIASLDDVNLLASHARHEANIDLALQCADSFEAVVAKANDDALKRSEGLGEDPSMDLSTLQSLGQVYLACQDTAVKYSAMGENENALKLLNRILDVLERCVPEDQQVDVWLPKGKTMSSKAMLLTRLGKWHEAYDWERKALAYMQSHGDFRHEMVIKSQLQLAWVASKIDHLDECSDGLTAFYRRLSNGFVEYTSLLQPAAKRVNGNQSPRELLKKENLWNNAASHDVGTLERLKVLNKWLQSIRFYVVNEYFVLPAPVNVLNSIRNVCAQFAESVLRERNWLKEDPSAVSQSASCVGDISWLQEWLETSLTAPGTDGETDVDDNALSATNTNTSSSGIGSSGSGRVGSAGEGSGNLRASFVSDGGSMNTSSSIDDFYSAVGDSEDEHTSDV